MTLFNELFDVMKYPAGEPHVSLKSGNRYIPVVTDGTKIISPCYDFNDLLVVGTGAEILARKEIHPEFVIPYFPFGRHDRRRDSNDGFELEIALDFIKGINVSTIDPHSEVTAQLPHYSQSAFVRVSGLAYVKNCVFAIPDAGAAKKAHAWASLHNLETVQCLKERDIYTGDLHGFRVLGDVDGRDVVVVDDICDAGGTFIGLAQELFSHGARNLTLAVTHGLFTKGVERLVSNYHQIFTLDTCTANSPAIVKIPTSAVIQGRKI